MNKDINSREEQENTPMAVAQVEEYEPNGAEEVDENVVDMLAGGDTDITMNDTLNLSDTEGVGVDDLPVADAAYSQSPVRPLQLPGKKQEYYVPDLNDTRGDGKQARVVPCKGQEDGRDYILKLYFPKMVREKKLNEVLNFLVANKSPYVEDVVEHGRCQVENETYHYAIVRKYESLNRLDYAYISNVTDRSYDRRMVGLIEQVHTGIKFLHENQIYHCDIKPDNIMWDRENRCAVLIDFGGSARAKKPDETIHMEEPSFWEAERSRFTNPVEAAAVTKEYLPREARGGREMTKRVDYYSFGVSMAELINGEYPGNRDALEERVGVVTGLRFMYLAKQVPSYYRQLLLGLLFEDEDIAKNRKYRWNAEMVERWIQLIKQGKDGEALRLPVEPEDWAPTPAAEVPQERTGRQEYRFKDGIYLELGLQRDPPVYYNLQEMADDLAQSWEEGIEILKHEGEENNIDIFEANKVDGDLRKVILKTGKTMRAVAEKIKKSVEAGNGGTGESVEAEYAKFLYKFVSDKSIFRWRTFPNVRDKVTFGAKLLTTLRNYEQTQYQFGEWWSVIGNRQSRRSEPNKLKDQDGDLVNLAEIFYNNVFSTYLRQSGEKNQQLLAQCKTVEKLFEQRKALYTYKELAEMYLLAYLLIEKKDYDAANNKSYDTLSELVQDMDACVSDPLRIQEIEQVWVGVKNKEDYKPEFQAWMKLQEMSSGRAAAGKA